MKHLLWLSVIAAALGAAVRQPPARESTVTVRPAPPISRAAPAPPAQDSIHAQPPSQQRPLPQAFAQRFRSRGYSDRFNDATIIDRNGVPDWQNDEYFRHDVFTFVRIRYTSYGRRGWSWRTDFPDSDLNFSYRLQQLTSLKVDPQGRVLDLTDPELFQYPFIYMIEPGGLYFDEAEVTALRRYLFNGGFLMVDDFWGENEWANFYEQIKRVFPEREPVELEIDHPIFHCVYDLAEKPQIPSIGVAQAGRASGRTWERYDAQEVHYRAFFDDEGRMMVFIGHNTDLGDGWEQEGEDPWYFTEFSEKWAYPLGINIVYWAMTH